MNENADVRKLRVVFCVLALVFFGVVAAVLLRPLEPSEIPAWNVLVEGYTIIGWLMATISLFMALSLGLIAVSRKRKTLIKRLKGFVVLCVVSCLCLVILDLLLPVFMPATSMMRPALANIMGLEGSPFVVDEEFGIRYRAGMDRVHVIDMFRDSDLIVNHEITLPLACDEPENGMRIQEKTDRDGFVNDSVLDKCDVFVVGDSYVTPPVPYPSYWTSVFKQKTGKSVYNAGTASYSMQQELLVLRKYGLDKEPGMVVWGYFQGNDLLEAEIFDQYKKSGLAWREYCWESHKLGDKPFPYNRPLVQFLMVLAGRFGYVDAYTRARGYQVPCALTASGKSKTYAFYRNYMSCASHSREDIADSRGWEICCTSLKAAKAECDKIGARFVVVYFPAKITVLFEQMENEYDWEVYYRYLCHRTDVSIDSATQARELISQNRGAQCELLARFCEQNGIDFVDTTQSLKDAAQAGRWPYYSYDTHLNIEGNRVVAETLADYLKD